MHEFAWWYLYIQILNAENERRREINDIVESILPWLNLELWREVQKEKEHGRENIDFEDQFRAMLDGTWDADPNAVQTPRVDDLTSSAAELFDQQGRSKSIKDTLFPGQGPTFQGNPEDIPPEYRDFYKDLPDVEDFPPEEPEKGE